MSRVFRARLGAFLVLTLSAARPASAQSTAAGGAPLREVHAEGAKILTEAQIVSLAGLQPGSQVGKDDLQAAADRLIQSGLFAKVNFNFQTRGGGVFVTYHLEESPRLPVYFDNIPWFADSELADAIRKTFPYFDGTLPEAGAAVDRAGDAVKELLSSHGLQAAVEHAVIPNPVGEGNVQEFRIEGAPPQIATVEFSDPSLLASKAVQQHLSEIRGKAYSRMAIDLFLTEAIRPVYLQQGYLRVKLGPPEVRLTGNPNQKFPERIPVYVPVVPGAVFRWKEVHWAGNTLLSEFTLSGLLGAKSGDVANGMQIQEGIQYNFGKIVLTGLSRAAERKLYAAWPIASSNVFDKTKFEELLVKLQSHREQVFGELPVHYETVGHFLQTDPGKRAVDVLLDFK